jgi:hypothetical protein
LGFWNSWIVFQIPHQRKNHQKQSEPSLRKDRQIANLSADCIFGVTNGIVKPAKHLQLGIALKSITRQRKVIDIFKSLWLYRQLQRG